MRENPSDPRQDDLALSRVQKDAFRYKVSALSQLNKHLTTNAPYIAEATVLYVALLLGAEAIFGDIAALNAHSKSLSQIIEIFGGEEVFSPAISTLLLLIDIEAAAVRQTQPIFPLRPYAHYKFNSVVVEPCYGTALTLPSLGSRFSSLPLSFNISPELQQCIPYARHLILVSEQYRVDWRYSSTYGMYDFTAIEHVCTSFFAIQIRT